MPGPLPIVDTKVDAIMLDVDRKLSMGRNVVLGFYVPDKDADERMRLVRAYDKSFNRISGDEQVTGDGETVIFHMQDVFPAGQLAEDLAQRELHLRWSVEGVPASEYCRIQDIVAPPDDETQLWIITAKTRTFRKAYMRR
jgi:hypothetical protein